MNQPICQGLDDFLAGELGARARAAFAAHAAACPSCQQAVRLQQTIDRLLAEGAVEEPSPLLAARIERRIARRPLRRALLGVGAGAAAVLAFALWRMSPPEGSLVVPPPGPAATAPNPIESAVAQTAGTPDGESTERALAAAPPLKATVRLENTEDYIPVPIESTNDQVTIVWLYPILKTPEETPQTPATGRVGEPEPPADDPWQNEPPWESDLDWAAQPVVSTPVLARPDQAAIDWLDPVAGSLSAAEAPEGSDSLANDPWETRPSWATSLDWDADYFNSEF